MPQPAIRRTFVHGYGYIPDLPDHRDHELMLLAPPTAIPVEVHLEHQRGLQFPIYDQGNLGSCVGNATAAALQFLYRQMHKPNNTPSRLAIYYGARMIEGSVQSDSGCMIRDAIKVVVKAGAGSEHLWPYHVARFRDMPSSVYFANAAEHQALVYARVQQSRFAIRQTLAAGFPIVFGISVYESFESADVSASGIVPLPTTMESLIGGHAMLMCGYTENHVIVRNSWGPEWGTRGYCALPWDYVTNPDLAEDFWVIKSTEA